MWCGLLLTKNFHYSFIHSVFIFQNIKLKIYENEKIVYRKKTDHA